MQPTNRHRNFPCAFAMTGLILATCAILQAQQNLTSATLTGSVEDSKGALIEGASVVARNIATGQGRTTSSNDQGRFRFPYLAVGTYEIVVEAQGFARLRRQLTLTMGQAFDLTLNLAV